MLVVFALYQYIALPYLSFIWVLRQHRNPNMKNRDHLVGQLSIRLHRDRKVGFKHEHLSIYEVTQEFNNGTHAHANNTETTYVCKLTQITRQMDLMLHLQ